MVTGFYGSDLRRLDFKSKFVAIFVCVNHEFITSLIGLMPQGGAISGKLHGYWHLTNGDKSIFFSHRKGGGGRGGFGFCLCFWFLNVL